MRGVAQHKTKARRALHQRAAVSAFYQDNTLDAPVEVIARWHTKLSMAGKGEDGFDAQIIEGVNRLVFQGSELTSEGRAASNPPLPPLPDGLDELELVRGGTVTIPDLGDLVFTLDHREEPDGPLNIYWGVVQE